MQNVVLGYRWAQVTLIVALALAGALITGALRPVGGHAFGTQTIWQLGTTTERVVHANSNDTLLDWHADGQGGYVDEKYQGTGNCAASFEQYRFSWTFSPSDISTLTSGSTFSATLATAHTGEGGASCANGPAGSNVCMSLSDDGDTFIGTESEIGEQHCFKAGTGTPGPKPETVGTYNRAGYAPGIFIDIGGFAPIWGLDLAITYPYASPLLLGGMDLNRYCKSLGYLGATLNGTTINDWHCAASIDVNSVCHQQYQANAVGKYTNFNVATSWGCYVGTSYAGGMNLSKYCQSKGYLEATLDGTTVNDWHCAASIDVNSVCRQQYQANSVARYTNFNVATSWGCYAPASF